MALKGSIKEFGLAEIFELIFHQHKEGVLTMTREKESVVVLFKEGKIVQADAPDHNEALLKRLGTAALLSNDQAGIIRYRIGKGNKSIEALLVELEFIAESEMMRLSKFFTEECLFGLFHWDSGEYQFEQQKVTYNSKLITPLETQFLLMEGVRQIDEWPSLLKKISSRTMVFDDISEPDFDQEDPAGERKVDPEDPFASFSELGDQMEKSDPWLLAQVAGGKNVQQMIDQALMHSFAVYQGLAELLKEKKIEKISQDEKALKRSGHPLDKETIIRGLLAVLIIAMTLGLFVISVPSLQSVTTQTLSPFQKIKTFSKKNEAYFIRYALDLYYLKHHRYPDKLPDLFGADLFGVKAEIIFEASEVLEGWSYKLTSEKGDQFQLN